MKQKSYLTYIKNNKMLLGKEVKKKGFKLTSVRFELEETPKECLKRGIKKELSAKVKLSSLKERGKEIAGFSWFALTSTSPLRPPMKTHVITLLKNGGYLR